MRWLGMLVLLLVSSAIGQQGLQVQFGAKGLMRLSYGGQVLEDVERWPKDELHIWHMKCTDARGRARTDWQYGWGENHSRRDWDLATRTWTYSFVWGSITVHYEQRDDALEVQVTESNRAESGVVLDGASVYPVTLHPAGRVAAARVVDDLEEPGITSARWSSGEAVVAVEDAREALFTGFEAGRDGAYAEVVSGTLPDALPSTAGRVGRALKPGQTDRFTVSLRFAAADTPVMDVAEAALRSFATRWPEKLEWKDRRVIGTVFLASSPQGEKTRPAGFERNPRRYFTDAGVDVVSEAGLRKFQHRVLEQAQEVVANLRRLGAQGAITWDVEGEQYPQDTSYVCAPDQIAEVSPEMESVISEGRYAGSKLVDAYFRTIRDAGFRVGVCVRPQRFHLAADRSARQESLPDAQAIAELERKVRYAHDRWGATLFYLDSTVRADGVTLPAEMLERLAAAVPDSLLIPEESTPRLYRAAAPFQTFLFHGDTGTGALVRSLYPRAFSVNLINDVDAGKLQEHRKELVGSIRNGDVLMVHADHWQANDATVAEMYREATRK